MINMKDITKGVKTVLDDNLSDYIIQRNPKRNDDPNTAAQGKGWIGIYRSGLDYDPYTTGAQPWLAHPSVMVEIQTASFLSGEDAEDRLQDAEKEVMDVLTANKTLNNTVSMTNGYEIKYEFNEDEEAQVYFHAAIITIKAEVRA